MCFCVCKCFKCIVLKLKLSARVTAQFIQGSAETSLTTNSHKKSASSPVSMLIFCLLACLAVGVAAFQMPDYPDDVRRFWCSKFVPDERVKLTELQGRWQHKYFLSLYNSQLDLNTAAVNWVSDPAEPLTIYNATDTQFKIEMLSKKTKLDTYKNLVFRQEKGQPKGRFSMENTENDPSEEGDLLIITTQSSRYLVLFACLPPLDSHDIESVPPGAQVLSWVSVLTRERDTLSKQEHRDIQDRVLDMLKSEEKLVGYAFNSGGTVITWSMLWIIVLALV